MFDFSQISRIMIPILQLLNMIETNSAIAVPHIFNILKDYHDHGPDLHLMILLY